MDVPAEVQGLLSWAAARGATWLNLRPHGRTFVAVDDVPAGAATPLISVPLALLLPVSQVCPAASPHRTEESHPSSELDPLGERRGDVHGERATQRNPHLLGLA